MEQGRVRPSALNGAWLLDKGETSVKRKHWIVLAVLVLATLTLTGCGVPLEGVDVTTTQPDGFWQTFVVWPLANILIWLNQLLGGLGIAYSWGWAIILFTLGIKLITFPLNLSQIRGMQAQKDLQPRLTELQKKYGKDREKLAQEQMKLYKEAGVNPLSGCLPLLVQMPILFGLYAALVAVGPLLENAGFYWIPDLSYPKYNHGLNWIPELWQAGDYIALVAYLILPVLLVVTQIFMQKWMTPPSTGGEQAKMMQNMSMIMTLFFGWFTLQVPSGLTLYWVISNLLQMGQQWAVTRFLLKKEFSAAETVGASAMTVDAKPAPAKQDKPSTAVPSPKRVKAKGK